MTRGQGILPGQRLRGRGAASNAAGRFEGTVREGVAEDALQPGLGVGQAVAQEGLGLLGISIQGNCQ